MKKIILCFITILNLVFAKGQILQPKKITGSWINLTVANYYKSLNKSPCDLFNIDQNKLVPLYLSFGLKDLIITYRYEQRVSSYKITRLSSSLVKFQIGKENETIELINGIIKLQYRGNLVIFEQVSDNYSNDVFGEFIKGIIFKKNNIYNIVPFKDINDAKTVSINRSNFQQIMKSLFKCDVAEIAELGTFKQGNICLPEIAFYYNVKNKYTARLRTLGIMTGSDYVKLVDSSGVAIITLIPQRRGLNSGKKH